MRRDKVRIKRRSDEKLTIIEEGSLKSSLLLVRTLLDACAERRRTTLWR